MKNSINSIQQYHRSFSAARNIRYIQTTITELWYNFTMQEHNTKCFKRWRATTPNVRLRCREKSSWHSSPPADNELQKTTKMNTKTFRNYIQQQIKPGPGCSMFLASPVHRPVVDTNTDPDMKCFGSPNGLVTSYWPGPGCGAVGGSGIAGAERHK